MNPPSAPPSSPSPPRYHTNELSILRPDGFVDQTFHVLSQSDTEHPFSIVISRSRIGSEDTLEAIAQRLLGEMQDSLGEFELIVSHEGTIDGIGGRAIEYRWQQEGKPLQQIQLLFLHQDEQGQALLMQITGTSSQPSGMTDAERQRFGQFVASVQLRRESGA